MRVEKDFLGELRIPDDALYGIHSMRAKNNFPDSTDFHIEWYQAVGTVKQACYFTYQKFIAAKETKFPDTKFLLPEVENEVLEALIEAAGNVSEGKHFEHFIVPAIQGGAGTSINLNVNEIVANLASQKLCRTPGDYTKVDPFEDANLFQSTNDVIPTALKVAAIRLLEELEGSINSLRFELEQKELAFRSVPRIAYTQMQEAVPSSYGALFSAYNEALSRDWWRVSKCFERLKVVNLGGGAVGTGISIPRFFIMEVVPELQRLTNLPISRSENLSDTTSNLDTYVEVHAILKSHAVNLEKMVNDLRLLSSDLSVFNELQLPKKQVGSSIMPGKVNPVIPEFVIAAAHRIYANDQIVTSLSAQGCLDLNANLPLIGHALLESIKLLLACNQTVLNNIFRELTVSADGIERMHRSPSITTALSPYIGYHEAARVAGVMKEKHVDIFTANKELKLLSELRLEEILRLDNLLKLGFTLNDIAD
jgi:aspartate ammonia-lyase